jgi:peptidoglycan/LPS O-acetylase OafA/YrhL
MRVGIITIVAVILAFLALDDITTDNSTSFVVERTALVICTMWFAHVSVRTRQRGRRGLGNVSIGLTVAFALAQTTIGRGTVPSRWVEYSVALAALVWFAVLAGILVWSNRRPNTQPATGRT